MAIDVRELQARPLEPVVADELDLYERTVADFLDGRIDEDVFRVFRLNNGVYGQRQGGHNQMLRVKIPYGKITPEQLETFAYIAETYSRGWGHLTTRQNLQFHFIQLEQTPEILRLLAAAELTSREACGDTVRNVMGCHLAGACPQEVLDITPWAEATARHLLRHAYSQRLPRKFKINFSGCQTDCGQAMFNDVGVVAVNRTLDDGTTEAGFRVFIAGGLGANPHPALALEEFTSREDLLPTIEALLRTFDHYGNRDNKIRARMKWLVDTMGIDEFRERVKKERKFLRAARFWPGGIPEQVRLDGDAPAGGAVVDSEGAPTSIGVPVQFRSTDPYQRWVEANVVRGAANGKISAMAYSRLGDVTVEQFRALAAIQRDFGLDIRITNRQNFALRELGEADLRPLYDRLLEINMAEPGAELARDVVSCPGADTCNLAVTQSRGLASAIGDALEDAGLAEVGGVRVNISGCTNSCGQHHVSDIGFFGLERRAHGRAAPGYQMLLGGHLSDMQVEFGQKSAKLPAKSAPEAVVRIVGKFAAEKEAGETFATWMERTGGVKTLTETVKDLDSFPTPDVGPDFYVDYDETGPYEAEIGEGELRDVTTLDSTSARPLVDVDLGELAAVSAELERKPASAAIKWAHERFGDGLVLAASFQDCVLIDVASKVAPGVEVVFLDTQYHFAETLWYVERIRERYDLNLRVMEPLVPPDDLWQVDTDECCAMRKVEPLARALDGKQAWMSGLRRAEAPSRAKAQIAHLDVGRGIVKVNPLAPWTDDEIDAYKRDHDLLEHPLVAQGYASIGCWPCTRPVAPGEDRRAGRWAGEGKTECGLHGWPNS